MKSGRQLIRSVSLAIIVLISIQTSCSYSPGSVPVGSESSVPRAVAQEIELAKLDGVDPALEALLKHELIRVLANTGMGKAASAPPTGAANAIGDLTGSADGSGGVDLHWKYRNVGDYDQNSEVNVADLTPIGRNFSATAAVENWLDAALADGDENGEVNVSDITPIGRNFNHVVSAYRIYASADPADYPPTHDSANGAGAVLVGTVDMSSATEPEQGGKEFSFSLAAHVPGTGYWVRPIDSAETEGSPSNLAHVITLSLDIDPGSAHLPEGGSGTEIDPYELLPGTSYDLLLIHIPDGDVTSDPGTTFTISDPAQASVSSIGILNVEPDASGTFNLYATYESVDSQVVYFQVPDNEPPVAELIATPASTMRNVPVSLNAAGSADPDGTIENYEWDFDEDGVFNESGDESAAEGSSSVQRQWADAGSYSVRVQVTDNRGAKDNASVAVTVNSQFSITVDSENWSGEQSSLAVVNGVPAIAYSEDLNDDLRYSWANDITGTSWNTVSVDSAGQVGARPSLEIVEGFPAIAYYDGGNQRILYVRAEDASGSTWGSPVVASDETKAGNGGISMAVVDGMPAIAFDVSGGKLYYARSLNSTGSSWDSPLALDTQGGVGQFCSLAVVDGNPAIAYYNGGWDKHDLMYIRASDASGAAWNPRITVQSAGTVGQYCTLAVVDGIPAIAYVDVTNQQLMFVRATNAPGSAWGSPVLLDGESLEHRGASLAVIDGRPGVSYHSAPGNFVRFVWASDATGTNWNAPLAVAAGGGSSKHNTSLAVVDGRPAISYYNANSSSLRYAVVY